MAIRPIILMPDPVLRKPATPVESVDNSVRALMDDMLESMYAAPGLGLAAPQVGVSKRVLVMDCSDDDADPAPIRMANPEITVKSDATATTEEGCLSIPDHKGEVTRPAEVTVGYLDETGAQRELHATGLLAVCVQHEIDHLDGVLFIDHLSRLKRNMIERKMKKDAKEKPR